MIIIIIILTTIISYLGFNDVSFFQKYMFNPYAVIKKKQYYRLLTHGFLHSDWMHLAINMFVLYSFGSIILKTIDSIFYFLLLYLGGIVVATFISLRKHKENYFYNSVGASGGVSSVVFSAIFFYPLEKIYIWGIIGLPGIILGLSYLGYSYYMGQKNKDNVNHDAHFAGAVFGFFFPVIFGIAPLSHFLNQLFD